MSKHSPQTPHDRLFKEVFSNPANAASELEFLLPKAVVNRLDLSSLTLQPGEFIDKELRARQSDLLFSAKLKRFKNRHACVMDAFITLMRYYMTVARGPKLEQVQKQLRKVLGPQSKKGVMTLAEVLRREGEAKGKTEGEVRALLTVLDARGWKLSQVQQKRIQTCTDLSTIEQWVRKAVTASCLREVFTQNSPAPRSK
ncbi:MAG: Rpn family recombination-promoting nuclease/putative transposase [Myxococcota bacterium]